MVASKSFPKRFNKKNLLNTYTKKIKDRGAVGIDKINGVNFHKNLLENIHIILRKVNNNTYKFTTYRQKLISKGADKIPRQISIPTFRDRLTLRSLCDLLFDVYSMDIKAEIPQVKIHHIYQQINSNIYDEYIKIDIKKFYSSIDHTQLESTLNKKVKKVEIRSLLRKAIKNGTTSHPNKNALYINNVGIPQGLSISNILAEIFMIDFDKNIQDIPSSIHYVRYVDDILILCNQGEAEAIGNIVINLLTAKGLEAHPLEENSKSEFGNLSEEFSFLGYLFDNYQTTVGKGSQHRFESSIVRLLTTYKYKTLSVGEAEKQKSLQILEWRLNLRITGCIFDNTKRGWIFYYSQISDITVLHELESTIKKLLIRFNIDDNLTIKSLVKTYFLARTRDVNSNKYIINFDELDKEEKISILKKYLGTNYALHTKSEEEINKLFKMRIGKVIKELEEDLQDFS